MIINTQLEHKGDLFPSKIISYKQEVDSIDFNTDNNVILRVTVLRDSMIRFRFTAKGYFSNDFSYAIDKSQSHGYNLLEVTDETDHYRIRTSKVYVVVQKHDLRVGIYDLNDNAILEDEIGFHWEECYEYGGNIVKMSKTSHDGESFYGLGDRQHILILKANVSKIGLPISTLFREIKNLYIKLSLSILGFTAIRLMVFSSTTPFAPILISVTSAKALRAFGQTVAK